MEQKTQFPRTKVAGVSLSRMLIGTNWMLGYSHTGPAADRMIRESYAVKDDYLPILEAYLKYGVDTIMGPASTHPALRDAILYTQEKTGRKLILVDTPIVNVSDSSKARREAEATVRESARIGATFCLLHTSSVEQLVNKNTQTIDRIGDYTGMIREAGLIPGLSTHQPEAISYSDANGYDIETYIQIYNCLGFLMQVEIETVAETIHNAKKPVMTIKPMAAGRCTPYVGLNFAWATLRPCDMITVGAFTAAEVHEDVEISLAALEGRFPKLKK